MPAPAETLLISVVQADLKWEDKRANLRMFEDMIATSQEKMEVVLLPEMFSTGFIMQPQPLAENMEGETIAWMKRVSAEYRIILAGSLIIEEEKKYFNRLIWMLPNGSYGYYDKRHLFAYAGEDAEYSSGNRRLITSVKGWKLNLLICYDLRFPVWARQSAGVEPGPDGGWVKKEDAAGDAEYDVLVYVANWPEKRVHAWKTLLQARAIENQCYVAGCNRVGTDGGGLTYSGDSMIVDPMGEIIATKTNEPGIITLELRYSHLKAVREKLPFLRDSDPFIIGRSQP